MIAGLEVMKDVVRAGMDVATGLALALGVIVVWWLVEVGMAAYRGRHVQGQAGGGGKVRGAPQV